jgi:hypothetical protein
MGMLSFSGSRGTEQELLCPSWWGGAGKLSFINSTRSPSQRDPIFCLALRARDLLTASINGTMVVFVDLEGDDEELQDMQRSFSRDALTSQHLHKLRIRDGQSEHPCDDDCSSNEPNKILPTIAERSNPNINGFSASLSCYP